MKVFLVALLAASTVSAQTYVRPSKGKSFNPFATTADFTGTWTDFPNFAWDGDPVEVAVTSKVYDWSAFSDVNITIYATNTGTSAQCAAAVLDTRSSENFTFRELGNYIKFDLYRCNTNNGAGCQYTDSLGKITFQILEGPTPEGPFSAHRSGLQRTAGTFNGCDVTFAVTPIPFSVASKVELEQGTSVTLSSPTQPRCIQRLTAMWTPSSDGYGWNDFLLNSTSGSDLLFSGTGPNLLSVKICNSPLNLYNSAMCMQLPAVNPTSSLTAEFQYYSAPFITPDRRVTVGATYQFGLRLFQPGECAEFLLDAIRPYPGANPITGAGTSDIICQTATSGTVLEVEVCQQDNTSTVYNRYK